MRGIAALGSTENAISDLERGLGRGVAGHREDGAGELGARDPGERRLVLVLAADLEEVEEVCGRGVDRDEVFAGFGGRRGEAGYAEIVGALGKCVSCVTVGYVVDGEVP